MFKKGSFEIGGDVYPVAIKVSPVKMDVGLSMNGPMNVEYTLLLTVVRTLVSAIRKLYQLRCHRPQ